ncbi:MAG: hypothetical protein ACOXZ9_03945 [Bacteroidales bacterium]|jgi:hypothetical protein
MTQKKTKTILALTVLMLAWVISNGANTQALKKFSKESKPEFATKTALLATTAAIDDIDPYLGISIGALNASYDKLDSDVYFILYKNMPGMFFTNSGYETHEAQAPMRNLILYMMTSNKEAPCLLFQPRSGTYGLPADFIINSNFAVFSAFPKEAYPLFVEARMLIHAMEDGRINTDYENTNTLVAYMPESEDEYGNVTVDRDVIKFKYSNNLKYGFGFKDAFILMPPGPKTKQLVRWKEEEARLMELYLQNVTFQNVKNTFFNTLIATVKASKAKNWYQGVYASYKLEVLAEDMKSHPDKVEDQDYKDGLATYESLKTNNYPKWEAFINRNWMEIYAEVKGTSGGNEIPKAAKSDPKLEAEMIAIARTIYEDGRVPVKAIIKHADWNYTHNAFGQIVDRYQTAFIIFKMTDGTHRMVDIGFKQLYDGSRYGKTQLRGIGMLNIEVDYK